MQKELEISAVIGYKGIYLQKDNLIQIIQIGNVHNGLILHPDNEHIIFPLGSTIILRNIIARTQSFLRGHDNQISFVTVSPSGKYIASGQKTHMGFQVNHLFKNSQELFVEILIIVLKNVYLDR